MILCPRGMSRLRQFLDQDPKRGEQEDLDYGSLRGGGAEEGSRVQWFCPTGIQTERSKIILVPSVGGWGLRSGVWCGSFFSRKPDWGIILMFFKCLTPHRLYLQTGWQVALDRGVCKGTTPFSPVPSPCYICRNTHIFSQTIPFILSVATFSLYMHVELNQYPLSVVLLSKILD